MSDNGPDVSGPDVSGPDRDDPDPSLLAALYALNALDGDDLRRFEHRLDESSETQSAVDDFAETAARLSILSATAPPPEMRERVLAGLGDVAQEPRRLMPRVQGTSPIRTVLLAAAAAVILVVAGLVGYSLRSSGPIPSAELANVLSAEDVRISSMEGTDGTEVGLVYSVSKGRAVVVASDLPEAPEGKVYQLWRVRGDQPVSAGTLVRPQKGPIHSVVEASLTKGDVVAITVEPAPGAEQPTSPVLLSAQI